MESDDANETGADAVGDGARLGIEAHASPDLLDLVRVTRDLVDRVRRTGAPSAELVAIREAIEALRDRLDATAHPGPFAQAALDGSSGLIGQTVDPMVMFPYSPVSGLLNPLAPPAHFRTEAGRVVGEVTLGPAWCGPPNHVHGGVVAALMDELLGCVNVIHDLGAMTGRLTIHYRAPTPLGVPLRLEAEHVGREGRKVFSRGRMWHGEVLLCEAEGLFVRLGDIGALASAVSRDA